MLKNLCFAVLDFFSVILNLQYICSICVFKLIRQNIRMTSLANTEYCEAPRHYGILKITRRRLDEETSLA